MCLSYKKGVMMYDLIGDIHGHATELKLLLQKMGYIRLDGVWQHSERKVIFLGDFVDRGPEQLETLLIVQSMVESGSALAVMGNHEYNAVAWATEDPKNPGRYLRPHTEKNLEQHRQFLNQVSKDTNQLKEIEYYEKLIQWFKTLPVYLDLPNLRVVHACWHPLYIDAVKKYTDSENRLLPEAWEMTSRKDTEAFNCIETLLKGWEINLPPHHYFLDKDGHKRTKIRTKWWKRGDLTYKNLAMVPPSEAHKIPDDKVDMFNFPTYDCKKPLFIGHYWLSGEPAPMTEYIACLDYSVAGVHGGKLCAYQYDESPRLSKDNFIWANKNLHSVN